MSINEFKQQMREAKVHGYELSKVEMNGESFLTYSNTDFIANMLSHKKFTEEIPNDPIVGGLMLRKK